MEEQDLSTLKYICKTYDKYAYETLSECAKKILKHILEYAHKYSPNKKVEELYKILFKKRNISYKTEAEKSFAYDNLKTITGPVSFSEWTVPKNMINLLGDKHIYVFGDIHIMNIDCDQNKHSLLLAEFIEQFIDNSENTVDVLFESATGLSSLKRLKKSKTFKNAINDPETYRNHLVLTNAYFMDCLVHADCNNSRFHHVDIRKDIPGRNADDNNNIHHTKLTDKNVQKYIGLYSRENIKKYIKVLGIKKQTDKISNTKLRNMINSYFEKELNKYYKLLDTYKSKSPNKLSDIRYNLRRIDGNIMDWYLIGRVFSTFKDGYMMKNIIIYAGRLHTNNYDKLFSYLGMNMNKSIKGNENLQCLDVSKISFPKIDKTIKTKRMNERLSKIANRNKKIMDELDDINEMFGVDNEIDL